MAIIPGRYAIRMSKMRLREYYRMGGFRHLAKGIQIKLGLREEPQIGERRFPHTVAQEICTEEEMDQLVLSHLQTIEARVDIGQRIFCVANKTPFDPASKFKVGGCYSLIGENTIGFYMYSHSADAGASESETFTCMSFSDTKAFATSNIQRYGFDLPPEIAGHRMPGAPLEDVIGQHLQWISNMSLRTFSADNVDSIIEAVDIYGTYMHRDRISRGFYQLIEADR